jgi:hypothetical protein
MVRKCEEVKSASTRDGKIICYLQNGTKAVISSPDDLFKIGFQDVDYQKLGKDILVISVFQVFASRQKFNLQSTL